MASKIEILNSEVLSDDWYTLRKVTFNLQRKDGTSRTQSREAYDRGNGATILLFNRQQATVILTRQFRLPTYVNGNESGMLIETCAGLLDKDNPEDCIRREVMEETGYSIGKVWKLFQAYMSPGSVTELLYFFAAEYTKEQRASDGGGVEEEDIEVLEVSFEDALAMMRDGRIMDGKTIMLLQYAQINGLLRGAAPE